MSQVPSLSDDESRLLKLGYTQEVKRIFSAYTSFGLTASMISVLLGVIPLYTYQLQTGGPIVQVWSWVVISSFTVLVVLSLGEICSAFPTMGALYFWAYKLGGPDWGPFASWTAGWVNLLGQIAGVASGGFAGATILAEIIQLSSGAAISTSQVFLLYAAMLIIAGIANTFSETILTSLCYASVVWQICGILVIVAWILYATGKKQSASFVFGGYHNSTGFESTAYVTLIGSLTAASVFTGYDTAAHVAEETTDSHNSTPWAMLCSVFNALILGLVLIIGMNFCIQDIDQLTSQDATYQAYTAIWLQAAGKDATLIFLAITLFAIECSNCANLTSAARMVYSFSRDGGLPLSHLWYHINSYTGAPVRAIWLSVTVAFTLALPGLGSALVLNALFSLTATGLYTSYMIPILLRVTVSRKTFQVAEFNLGRWNVPIGVISVVWTIFMTFILCLPESTGSSADSLNYSPIALGAVLLYAWGYWMISARHWFKDIAQNTAAHVVVKSESQLDLNVGIEEFVAESESTGAGVEIIMSGPGLGNYRDLGGASGGNGGEGRDAVATTHGRSPPVGLTLLEANEDCDEEISELLTPKSPTSEFNDDS